MRNAFLICLVLPGILTLGSSAAHAQEQQGPPSHFQFSSADLAITYTGERSNLTSGGPDFWLQGGSMDASFTFYRGLGLAADATGVFSSNIAPHLGLVEIIGTTGPRYTFRFGKGSKHETRLFIEAMGGVVRASDSAFPKTTGFDTRASSFAYQGGGGVDIRVTKHIAIRAIQADFVGTELPNNSANDQYHLRLSFGVTFHTGLH